MNYGPIQPDAADRLINDIQKATEELFNAKVRLTTAEHEHVKAELRLTELQEKVRKELHRMKNWCGHCGIKCGSDHK